tara:strand:- start:328 stop:522 length:195 start_codon:yes stop_codon:yes gene_type:complete
METKNEVTGGLIARIICGALQGVCLIMMFFFGWLGTKMEIPDGATYFWLYGNVLLSIPQFIIKG